MNKLDTTFKEKLADLTMTPSAAAWEKLESGLAKKNDLIVSVRWAAVLALSTASAITLLVGITSTPSEVAQKISSPPIQKAEVPALAAIPDPSTAKQTESKQTRRKQPVNNKKETVQAATASTTQELPATITPITEVTIAEVTIEPAMEPQPEIVVETKPIVLVYTLESVTSTEASEEKKSKLGRVVEFANTVKHSDPLSDLRTMKDELLAIDLRKKSSKKN